MNRKTTTPVALVTQRVDPVSGRVEIRDALDQRLVEWLSAAGFLSFPMPNALLGATGADGVAEWLRVLQPDILVLSGGNDVGEQPARDATERHLLSWAQERRLPALGICRGMQMMAVWAGGTLGRVSGHVGVRHQLKLREEKQRSDWPEVVNSYHNWGVGNIPRGFVPQAWAEDGSVEAMRHKTLPWEAWMWHPEREEPFNNADVNRIERLLDGK
ncbi:gamma-glutamyl-gamma-aminobutyrate hydrolase family protein [Dechloromonas denitrificans]|uniref:gamma-glutamyl-gamma-aminobutyrate hydrolase family protein n=1 Tax=Dechloromonas denitrificans TaxID=281362 RepID=UPI001CFB01DE|nr:gamma-glutamyl-gamma-aminobutyrate hydrolase family protein [Dechloromonas denitrificans]UCV06667.1 gamma-glutamyl-gamma-aminobutyrate hydrolase family protein [Dechloromonas denitrificans]